MSVTTRNPLRMLGAIQNSGQVNTGELRTTYGGEAVFSALSGIGVDTAIASGVAGRLKTITRLTVASGTGVYFYEGTIPTSGGPFIASGHKILGALLQPILPAVSGLYYAASFVPYGMPVVMDMPFFSGLLAAPIASGCFGFQCSYTLEQSGTYAG